MSLGWVPPTATRDTTYLHLNQRTPDHVKYDLHVLLVEHGKKTRNDAKLLRKAVGEVKKEGSRAARKEKQTLLEKME